MKLTILLFSIFISFSSIAEWTETTGSIEGDTNYIDIDTIKERSGYVFYREFTDYYKPDSYGFMSFEAYKKGDCGENEFKILSFIFYRQSMGKGTGETYNPPNPEWHYPPPESVAEINLSLVCDYIDTDNKATSDYKKDLETIKDLLDSGLITKEDYEKQKQKILDKL